MGIPISLTIIAFAALIHASFQLSVSVLTILSGHSIGAKHSQAKLFRLTTSFLFGAAIMTVLLLSSISFVLFNIFGSITPAIVWSGSCGLLIGVAVSVWMFYYRRESGTMLWIPRNIAKFLADRTRKTKTSSESFSLGMTSVISETLFIIAPLIISGLVLIQLPPVWQFVGVIIYTIISLLPLTIVWGLIGGGHTLGRIQKWREDNKYFLQFSAGMGLIILSLFVYVYEILSTNMGVI